MSLSESESYLRSPLFHEAMDHFQHGKWDDGFVKLVDVEKKYPMDPELRALRQEMEVRKRISAYEVDENRRKKISQLSKYSIRIFSLLAILLIAFLAISTYSGWIQRQIEKAQTEFSQSRLQLELAVEYRNAQQLIAAGRPGEALAKYEYIKENDPNFPGLNTSITQAQTLQDTEIQYTQAMNLLQAGDSAQALAILQGINEKMPNFRDVSLQVRKLQSETEMTIVIQQADKAYLEGRYEDALSGYASLRLMDPTYQTSYVEDKLFQSYVRAAETLLAEPVPSMETLRKIDDYFSNALALKPLDREALAARRQVRLVIEDALIGDYLTQAQAAVTENPDSMDAQKAAEQYLAMAVSVRPNDPAVLLKYQIAQAYIKAVNDFASSNWDSVIDQLEFVIGQQAGYADGTAIQALYDAYIARGSDYVAEGEYSLALDDYQRSAVLAKQLSESGPLFFEAQTMIAEAQGLLNHFQEAVLIYQDALSTIGLRERITGLKNSLTDTLNYAEYLSNNGNYQNAFYAYRSLLQNRVGAYDQSTVVTVKSGDYISMLAHRYNTTVASILSANKLNNQPRLTPNTQLIIPILP